MSKPEEKLLLNAIYNTFISLFANQNNERILCFEKDVIFKEIKIALFNKTDRSINNREFTFKYEEDEEYLLFLTCKDNPLYGKKITNMKIKEKNLKLDLNKKYNNISYDTMAFQKQKFFFDNFLDEVKNYNFDNYTNINNIDDNKGN
jgi:hypothetical protein